MRNNMTSENKLIFQDFFVEEDGTVKNSAAPKNDLLTDLKFYTMKKLREINPAVEKEASRNETVMSELFPEHLFTKSRKQQE